MKKTPKVTKQAIQVVPDPGWVQKQKSKLPRRFPPYRLKGIEPGSLDEQEIGKIRELTDKQLDRLLGALGLERTMPNAWERAFFRLAVIHHGVGHITWTPPRGPNRRAQKWTIVLDKELKSDVRHFTAQGFNDTQALEKIAKDAKKCAKFRLVTDPRSETPDWKRHFETLKKRWTYIKKMEPFERLLQALGGGYSAGDTDADFALWLAASKEIPEPRQKGKSK
jgi:hypothetical protein